MVSLLKKHNLGCILMHMQGNPENMQVNPSYNRVSEEIGSFFQERLDYCQGEGIGRERIFIDPGIGFGKLKEHNLDIINNLYQFKKFGVPIFLGLSRKSFLGDIIKKSPAGRLGATIAAELVALNQGANVLRVHDVKETNEAIKVFSQLLKK
jgi:dihydropteroate synthase